MSLEDWALTTLLCVTVGVETFASAPFTQLYCTADWEATDDFHPDNTDSATDYEKNQFLDLRKPLFMQMWRANFRYVPSAGRITGSHFSTASYTTLSRCTNRATCRNRHVYLVPIY